tara:strand:+ start:886 stop:1062 length:177 start_codon:yes stop_codon:yes gene_type:complete
MTRTTWSLTVDENGVIEIPTELIAQTGWDDDTLLEWDVNEDGTISLRAVDPQSDQGTS